MSEYARRIVAGSLVAFIVAVSLGAAILYLSPNLSETSTSNDRTTVLCCATTFANSSSVFCSQLVPPGCDESTTTVYPTSGFSTSISSAIHGLVLKAFLNSTAIKEGGSILVNASLFNTLSIENNVSSASNWPLTNLTMTPCGPTDSPVAYAVVKGFYVLSNISSAPRIQYIGCTTVMGGVTMYSFRPLSDVATVVAATCTCSSQPVGWMLSLNGYITSNGTSSFTSGIYTVVVTDEWGDSLVASFSVHTAQNGNTVNCDVQKVALWSVIIMTSSDSTTYTLGSTSTETANLTSFTTTTSVSESSGYETTITFTNNSQTITGAITSWTQEACSYG